MSAIITGGCEHKTTIGCILTALSVCCACADKRPMAAAYPVYIDGEGMKMRGKRWARYCWKCRNHYKYIDPAPPSFQDAGFSAYPLSIMNSLQTPEQSEPSFIPHQLDPTAQPFTLALRRRSESIMDNASNQERRPDRMTPVTFPLPESSRADRVPPRNHPATESSQVRTTSSTNHHAHPQTLPSSSSLPPSDPPRQSVFPLGSREDVEQPDYQSPISNMFSNAYERYQAAEQLRRANQNMNISSSFNPPTFYPPSSQNSLMRPGIALGYDTPLAHRPNSGNPLPSAFGPVINTYSYALPQGVQSAGLTTAYIPPPMPQSYGYAEIDDGKNKIDRQKRPAPLTSKEMLVDASCKICTEQKIDTALLPCGHLHLCHWCSEAHRIECREQGKQWRCPVCKGIVVEVRRVYF